MGEILTILRDDKRPNMWNYQVVVGNRDHECVAREFAEVSIQLSKADVIWFQIYPSMLDGNKNHLFSWEG